jgi:hypothetical protein
VGAPYAEDARGQVYVVYGGPRASISATIPLSQANLIVSGAMTDTWLGTSVQVGDLNHDGTDDLLMGAIGIDPDDADGSGSGSVSGKGAAYALFGSGSLSGTVDLSVGNPADLRIVGASADDWLGRGLGVGDLNGDTFSELLVGAAGLDYTGGLVDTGAVYMVDLAYPQQITVTGDSQQVVAGSSVSFNATAMTWLGVRDVTGGTSFGISAAAGGEWESNVYTASRAGEWTVSGSYDSLSDTTLLSVVAGPLAVVTVSPGTVWVLPGSEVEFQAIGEDGEANHIGDLVFAWSIANGGGQIVATGPTTLTVRAAAADAMYTDTVVATSDGVSSTASIGVLNVAPVADFSCGACGATEGEPVGFDGSASYDANQDPLVYRWEWGDGTGELITTTAVASHTFTNAGVYTVTLEVTDDDGSAGEISHAVSIGFYYTYLPAIIR